MADPIELVMSDLEYLTARIKVIQDMAESTDNTMVDSDRNMRAISRECDYLTGKIAQIRKTLDPQISI